MKIGIDISQTAYPGSGVARYTHTLISFLLKYDSNNEYVLFFSSLRGDILDDLKKMINERQNVVLKRFYLPPTILNILWNNLHIAPIEWFIGKVDILITSDWLEPPSITAKKITTIHDLVIYKFPETSSPSIVKTQKRRLNWVKKESELIMCDSEATKKDVEKILKINSQKLKVIYPAVEVKKPSSEDLERVKKKYKLVHPFILTVGKLEPRKNIAKLVEAFQKTGINNTDLIIAGAKGWGDNDFKISDNVKFLGFVPDKDLYALYSLAEFFIYPSLYEGFGYPVVEAMSLSCPVAVSNNSSLAEITQDNGLLFNPNSVEDIAKSILQYHDNEELRDKMKERGLERAKKFSPEKFTEKLLEVINT
ncbi:MAG: glycosyltransferase family 4 protein [Candidatus Roizmanbacteria bacterium]|nr:MAG: glycosyltransferase family 4 protein [Candidatus Roizmanbacteria bacterium]